MTSDLKKEIEEKFFEFAYCRKCHMKANFCKCKIGQPIMELFQFEQALSTQKQELEKIIVEWHKGKYWINGKDVEELKQKLGEMK